MDVQLNFINDSNDTNNSEVVIFAQNPGAGSDALPVAWIVIQNCGRGDNHPFTYPLSQTIAASDSWGNYTPQQNAEPGRQFAMVRTPSGDELVDQGSSTDPRQIALLNALEQGSINAYVYKSEKLFASRTGLAPGQIAVFGFAPKIWIGVASQITEGEAMNAAIVSSIDTEISLFGIVSADIVMTGGGSGPTSQPFAFTLQNVVTA